MCVRRMSQTSIVLAKNPVLEPAQDFYRLRREGIGFIAQMAAQQWTDYNVHDTGIAILEAACYAITDLAFRIGWRIEDILTPQVPSSDPKQPYPSQAFFTARKILTVNPVTPDDFRRLLIDLQGVRNAWLLCKKCACDASYLAYCKNDALALSYTAPADKTITPVPVATLGLYEALLELEADARAGDLNDRKVELRTVYLDQAGAHTTIMELRFPDISLTQRDQWQLFLDADLSDASKFNILPPRFGAEKDFDVFASPAYPTAADRDNYVRKNWRTIFYASFEIDLIPSGKKITIDNAALRLISDVTAKNATTADGLRQTLHDAGFIRQYQAKERLARDAVQTAKQTLQKHRNLDEDYCLVKTVGIEEVAVCADVEVTPDADIEDVQARIWFAIENYFNPPVPFHTLQELLDAGEAVEDIFNGPELSAGFILNEDLQAASLKTTLRVSDIINFLMDIPGVLAINQLQLTKYDSEGNPISGAADPTWVAGNPVFDPNRTSASWLLFITNRYEPRLYLNLSRFLFYKNGLPFLPRMDEATDVLNQLRGAAQKPKNYTAANDLEIPKGTFNNPEDYFPVQYSFPVAYGIGPEGLPSTADDARRAKARQVKAYLMVFEQLLGDDLAQLAHTADLFSLDPSVAHTYFAHLFDNNTIIGYQDIAKAGITADALVNLLETTAEFFQRRNRFLDHLLARFGEDFREYALLLTNAAGDQVAEQQLIQDKIAFLEAYPAISHDRARAFDYQYTPELGGKIDPNTKPLPCWPENYAGVKHRISLLLGYPDLRFIWATPTEVAGTYTLPYAVEDGNGATLFQGTITLTAANVIDARYAADRVLIGRMVGPDSSAYDVVPAGAQFRLVLYDSSKTEIGSSNFGTQAAALDRQQQLMAWSANQRMIVVEHLLLRPKFPGDALYPACSDGPCATCGDEDPYSFRLTFVMPGWVAQYTDNLDLRHYAERIIQQETPSHLLGKTCWVGNDGFIENLCDDVIGQIADLLIAKGLTAGGTAPSPDEACACANSIYHVFTTAFSKWYQDKTLEFMREDALATIIAAEFNGNVKPTDATCTTVLDAALWAEVQSLMIAHFVEIALYGSQFERFETAWCKWLQANALIDWTEERLLARVEAILETNLTSPTGDSPICQCATDTLTSYGAKFYDWMQTNLAKGNSFENLSVFTAPPITLCTGMTFKPGTAEAIAQLLGERYDAYKEVSYRLWVVVNLLSKLRSTYPGATLHDCDDGSDQNPVRLDNTALGNYPIRTRLT
jgi:hypothetical protein